AYSHSCASWESDPPTPDQESAMTTLTRKHCFVPQNTTHPCPQWDLHTSRKPENGWNDSSHGITKYTDIAACGSTLQNKNITDRTSQYSRQEQDSISRQETTTRCDGYKRKRATGTP